MKTFIKKILLFAVLVFMGQGVVYLRFKPALPEEFTAIKKALSDKTEIIGFGDSSFFYSYKKDHDKRSIYKMLEHLDKNMSLQEITHEAYNLDIYEYYVRYIASHDNAVKLVLIPINLRSFSPHWDMRPVFQFEKEKAVLTRENPLFYMFLKPLSVFKLFDRTVKRHEFHNAEVFSGTKKVGKVKDYTYDNYRSFSDDFFQDQFTLQYMSNLTNEHRKIKSLRNIISITRKNNIRVIFFVLPIDHNAGRIFLGSDFPEQINKNVDTLYNEIKNSGCLFLDLSQTLFSQDFFWYADKSTGYAPNEHLREKGRRFVADELYTAVKKALTQKKEQE